jgi:hypothetical protein
MAGLPCLRAPQLSFRSMPVGAEPPRTERVVLGLNEFRMNAHARRAAG